MTQCKAYYCPKIPVDMIEGNEGLVYIEKHYHRLVKSIEEEGFRNPLFGVMVDGKVRVGPGKQRHKAAKQLGIETVPVLIWDRDGTFAKIKHGIWHVQCNDIETIEAYFDDKHFVDVNSYNRGRLAVKKTIEWRQER